MTANVSSSQFSPEISDALAALKNTGDAVKANLVERDELIDLALMAIVAESNFFVCGKPGIAKSAVFGDLFNRIGGARKNFFALTKGSVPELLLGPISLSAMKQDRIRYNTDGMLPDVHFAFIDEVFKGNALTRAAALTILNERQFFNGGQIESCPLIMCAAASNEYPDAHEDSAFWDRFVVRMHVERIADRANRRAMIRKGIARGRGFVQDQATISLDQIRTLIEARASVEIPDEIFDVTDQILVTLDHMDLDAAIGDRRIKESFYLVAASALLHGRTRATADDLSVLGHTLWGMPDTRREIQQTINRIISPELASITDLFDIVEEGFEQFVQVAADAERTRNHGAKMSAATKFTIAAEESLLGMRAAIASMEKNGRDSSRARELHARVVERIRQSRDIALVVESQNDLDAA